VDFKILLFKTEISPGWRIQIFVIKQKYLAKFVVSGFFHKNIVFNDFSMIT
jgi:hypothetical protein